MKIWQLQLWIVCIIAALSANISLLAQSFPYIEETLYGYQNFVGIGMRLLPIDGAELDSKGESIREESLPAHNSLRFGLKAGLLYEIKALPNGRRPVNGLTIVPSLWIEYPTTNVWGDYSWKGLSTYISVSLVFATNNPLIY